MGQKEQENWQIADAYCSTSETNGGTKSETAESFDLWLSLVRTVFPLMLISGLEWVQNEKMTEMKHVPKYFCNSTDYNKPQYHSVAAVSAGAVTRLRVQSPSLVCGLHVLTVTLWVSHNTSSLSPPWITTTVFFFFLSLISTRDAVNAVDHSDCSPH